MKKNRLLILAGILLTLFFSCEREEFTVKEAIESSKELAESEANNDRIRDSLNHAGGIISYSILVIPGGDKTVLKSTQSNFDSDTVWVTVSQWGKTVTKMTDKNGIVVFEDLRIGTVSVSISADNYTPVDFIAELIPERDSTVLKYYNVVRYAATMVPIFSTVNNLSTIKGKVTFESDLTNKIAESASGVEVIGLIDVENNDFINTYMPYYWDDDYDYYSNPSYYLYYTGKIRQIAYGKTAFRTTTDNQGNYTLQVPSTNNGLFIKLTVSEFVTDQKIILNVLNNEQVNSVQSIRTYFSSSIRTAGGGNQIAPSAIPWVPGAYVTFSAPTGDVNLQPKTTAAANAIIGESGIASVTVTNSGSGYTQAPILVISKGTGYNAIAAEASAVMSNGRITGVTITNAGQGYTPTDNPTVTVKDVLLPAGNPIPVFTYSVIDFTPNTTTGHGFTSIPTISVTSTRGSGVTAEAVMSGYVSNVAITNGGAEYTAAPTVVFSPPSPGFSGAVTATGTADMTDNNPLHSITALSGLTNGNFWYETTPAVTITAGTGSGAAAVAELKTAGRVERIVMTNAGTGYSSTNPPTVTISGGGGFGAEAYATVNGAGQVTVVLAENGQSFTSAPTITIDAPDVGGTQATATAVLSYQVNKITLTNPGSGYTFGGTYANVTITVGGNGMTNGTHVAPYPSMEVEGVNITNAGSGYVSAPSISFVPVNQNGAGAIATATMLLNLADVKVNSEGSGYVNTNDIKVTVTAPAGSYISIPTVTATLGKGILSDIQLPYGSGGDGYTAAPLVNITTPAGAPDRYARVTANVSGGAVSGFTIDDAGAGYPYSTSYTASITTNITGGSFAATVNKNSGQIIGVTISNPGEGYVVAPYIEFIYNGSAINPYGTTATATTTITDGRVTGITITNPGSGYYTAPTINFVIPANAVLAKGFAIFDANGSITGVNLITNSGTVSTNGPSGFGYITAPEVTITPTVEGVGRDAKAIAKIQSGSVVGVEMVNRGVGYLSKNLPGIASYNQTPSYNANTNLITYPTSAGKGFEVLPINGFVDYEGNSTGLVVTAGKTYVRDIYMGTGRRSTDGMDY